MTTETSVMSEIPQAPTSNRSRRTIVIKRRGSRYVANVDGCEPVIFAGADLALFVQQNMADVVEEKNHVKVHHRPDSSDSNASCPRRILYSQRKNTQLCMNSVVECVPPCNSDMTLQGRSTHSAGYPSDKCTLDGTKSEWLENDMYGDTLTATEDSDKKCRDSSEEEYWAEICGVDDDDDDDDSLSETVSFETSQMAFAELQRKCEEVERKYRREVKTDVLRKCSEDVVANVLTDIAVFHHAAEEVARFEAARIRQEAAAYMDEILATSMKMAVTVALARKCALYNVSEIVTTTAENMLSRACSRDCAATFVESKLNTILGLHAARNHSSARLVKDVVQQATTRVCSTTANAKKELFSENFLKKRHRDSCIVDCSVDETEICRQYENALISLQLKFEESQQIIQALHARHALLAQSASDMFHPPQSHPVETEDISNSTTDTAAAFATEPITINCAQTSYSDSSCSLLRNGVDEDAQEDGGEWRCDDAGEKGVIVTNRIGEGSASEVIAKQMSDHCNLISANAMELVVESGEGVDSVTDAAFLDQIMDLFQHEKFEMMVQLPSSSNEGIPQILYSDESGRNNEDFWGTHSDELYDVDDICGGDISRSCCACDDDCYFDEDAESVQEIRSFFFFEDSAVPPSADMLQALPFLSASSLTSSSSCDTITSCGVHMMETRSKVDMDLGVTNRDDAIHRLELRRKSITGETPSICGDNMSLMDMSSEGSVVNIGLLENEIHSLVLDGKVTLCRNWGENVAVYL